MKNDLENEEKRLEINIITSQRQCNTGRPIERFSE